MFTEKTTTYLDTAFLRRAINAYVSSLETVPYGNMGTQIELVSDEIKLAEDTLAKLDDYDL